MRFHEHFGEPESSPARRPSGALVARTTAVLVTVMAMCLVIMAPGANAALKAKTSAYVAVSAAAVAPGAAVGITGLLKKGTGVFPGAIISIQRKLNGTASWTTIKTARTNTAGQVKATVTGNHYNYDYRTVYKGATTAAASVSAAKTVVVRQTASITATSTRSPVAGNYITVSGKTSPALKGKTVGLQLLNGRVWQTVGLSKVSTLAAYTVKGKATMAGARSYRVYVSGATGVTGAATAAKTFNVYGWYHLSDLERVSSNRFGPQLGVSIAGTSYSRAIGNRDSFFWARAPYAEYNLSFRCTRFEATAGLSDLSASNLKVRMTTAVDSTEQDHGIFGLGQKTNVAVDTAGAFRLKVQNHYVSGTDSSAGKGIWGNARILCMGKP
jgi:hypothetical protein